MDERQHGCGGQDEDTVRHLIRLSPIQNGRITSLQIRGRVAFFGDLGYELDVTALRAAELDEIRSQIGFYKQYRGLFQHGTLYRLDSPFHADGNVMSWEVVDPKGSTAIACRYQLLNEVNPGYHRLRLQGLHEDATYRIDGNEELFSGSELMHAGFVVPDLAEDTSIRSASRDFASQLFIVRRID